MFLQRSQAKQFRYQSQFQKDILYAYHARTMKSFFVLFLAVVDSSHAFAPAAIKNRQSALNMARNEEEERAASLLESKSISGSQRSGC
jgi:hypothetical protein